MIGYSVHIPYDIVNSKCNGQDVATVQAVTFGQDGWLTFVVWRGKGSTWIRGRLGCFFEHISPMYVSVWGGVMTFVLVG